MTLQFLTGFSYVPMSDARKTFLVFGTAQNTGNLPIRGVKLRIDYEDASHACIASRVYEEAVNIQPGEIWEFEFPFTDPVVPQIRSYSIAPLRAESQNEKEE